MRATSFTPSKNKQNNQPKNFNIMKAQFNTKWTINTIRVSLFVATHVHALKGSEMWNRANQLLNWLDQFDNEDDMIAFTNTPVKFEEE